MRVSASEKLELIHLVEGSSLSVRRTLAEIGLPRSTFYAWYKRYLEGGPEALEDKKPRPRAAWNRIPDRTRAKVIETALVHTELSPRELACRMTDREGEFLSESSVYRILKAADLIESPAYILLQAADRFQNRQRLFRIALQSISASFAILAVRIILRQNKRLIVGGLGLLKAAQPSQRIAFSYFGRAFLRLQLGERFQHLLLGLLS